MNREGHYKELDLRKSHGEEKRDNDAHRPDGAGGSSHDSTAQKAARNQGRHQR
jgi:hypothetical protein